MMKPPLQIALVCVLGLDDRLNLRDASRSQLAAPDSFADLAKLKALDEKTTAGCQLGEAVDHGVCATCTGDNSACATVSCDADWVDGDDIATNGCETTCWYPCGHGRCTGCQKLCPQLNDGTCTACNETNHVVTCTALTCNPNYFDTNNDARDGCEDGCPEFHAEKNAYCGGCSNSTTCETMVCNENYFDVDAQRVNGCEKTCALLHGGLCTACTGPAVADCTALACDAGYTNPDQIVANGCECEGPAADCLDHSTEY